MGSTPTSSWSLTSRKVANDEALPLRTGNHYPCLLYTSNIESSHPGYDEYRYDLDMIGHDPHELAAYLSAVLQGYTRQSAQAELERVFEAQYQLTLTEEVEVRYRTETRTDSEGNSYTVQVPYNYYILNVKLTSKPISSVASELLTPEQLEMYQVYRQTLGNKPLIFGCLLYTSRCV